MAPTLRALLARFGARLARGGPERRPAGAEAGAAAARLPQLRPPHRAGTTTPMPAAAARRALLLVDDAGELLVASGRELVLGHVEPGSCDLPLLADVAPRHARILLGETLRSGPEWRVAPIGLEPVLVNGAPAPGPVRLVEGDLVRLGGNAAFRFRAPDPASASARLDLLHGAECLGAGRVLLLAAGPGGRVRLGPAERRLVRVPTLEREVALVLEEHPGGAATLRLEGAESRAELPFPPPARLDLVLGRRAGGGPPLGLALDPVAGPAGEDGAPPAEEGRP